jgi:o-succinylbenzoate synthase
MDVQTCIRICQEVEFSWLKHNLQFHIPAKTSRNTMRVHLVHYIVLKGPKGFGVGEYAPIPGLSTEGKDDFEKIWLEWRETDFNGDFKLWREKSSAFAFALETAFYHYEKGLDTPFHSIPINGLIWMADIPTMYNNAIEKINQGFTCIKFKIGTYDFDAEWDMIAKIRSIYPADKVTIRLDANGAFDPKYALDRLEKLAQLQIHSIEQPIAARQWPAMSELCANTPIPIALDEELIGIQNREMKERLLDSIQPQFIILKPTLHGGLQGCDEWIELAQKRNIGWWATSALESNVGLFAISNWIQTKNITLPQGLGTGGLYSNNIPSPLRIENSRLIKSEAMNWNWNSIF